MLSAHLAIDELSKFSSSCLPVAHFEKVMPAVDILSQYLLSAQREETLTLCSAKKYFSDTRRSFSKLFISENNLRALQIQCVWKSTFAKNFDDALSSVVISRQCEVSK